MAVASLKQLTISYRLLVITFFAVLCSVFTVNSGDIYDKLFKGDAADFTYSDIPFKERMGPMSKLVGYFCLFTLVYFIAILIAIYLYYVAIEKQEDDRFTHAFEKFVPFIWGSHEDTVGAFYSWLIIATTVTILFFLFYSMMNKSFLQEMKFPSIFKADAEDPTGDDPARPQPKIFLIYYALFCMLVLCFGIILTSVGIDINYNYVLLIGNLLLMIVVVVLIVTAFESILKKNMLFIVSIVFLLLLYIATVYLPGEEKAYSVLHYIVGTPK